MRTLIATFALLIALPAPAAMAHMVDKKDDGGDARISSISDDRIQESSGLAYSAKFPDVAYTNNDENAPIFTIRPSDGKVVGSIKFSAHKLGDPEEMYVDPVGHLWLGDLGDNDENRDDAAIYAFNEPGPGKFEVKQSLRFPVTYDRGPTNVEAMLINPVSGQVYLVQKVKKDRDKEEATIFALPNPLRNGQTNLATDLHKPMPNWVTDAEFTPDGRRALVKTEDAVYIYDPTDWSLMQKIDTPKLKQSETLTIEPDQTSFLIGSEGKDSPLVRVALPPDTRPVPTDAPTTSAFSDLADFEPVPAGGFVNPMGVSLEKLVGLVVIAGLVVGVASLLWLRVGLRRRRALNRIRRR